MNISALMLYQASSGAGSTSTVASTQRLSSFHAFLPLLFSHSTQVSLPFQRTAVTRHRSRAWAFSGSHSQTLPTLGAMPCRRSGISSVLLDISTIRPRARVAPAAVRSHPLLRLGGLDAALALRAASGR